MNTTHARNGARGRHPSYRRLLDVVDARDVLPPGGTDLRVARARDHAAGCRSCSAVIDRLRKLVEALRAGPLPVAGSTPSVDARALFASVHRAAGMRLASELDAALEAVLVLDGRLAPTAPLRGASPARLLYVFGDYELDLEMIREPEGATIRGGVLPPDDDPTRALVGAVRLENAGRGRRAPRSAVLAPDGTFVLERVPRGTWNLMGHVDGIEFRVRDLDIG